MAFLKCERRFPRWCPNVWLCITLMLTWAQHTKCLDRSLERRIVYPLFLEGRSESGARILKLDDGLTLHLEQRSAFDDKLLIRTAGEDNTFVEKFMDASEFNSKLFQDPQHMASAVVSEEDGLRLNGIIGEDMLIRPLLTMERTAEGHVPHLLYREESLKNAAALDDYVFMPRSEDPRFEDRQIRYGDVKEIQPEIHVVIDSVFYTDFGRKESDIIAYFGAVLNSINLRYATIIDPKVTVKITGFTLNKSVYDERYITTFGEYGEEFQQYVDMKSSLYSFRNAYRRQQPDLFAKVDAFVLVTGRDMCKLEESTSTLSCLVAGEAYVAGACTEYRAAIVEDKPWMYHSVRNIAHELAHSLGCVHDGDVPENGRENHPGATGCPWSDGYIMSYLRNSTNQFQFSSCCARRIKDVANLRSHICLHVNNTQRERPTTHYLPGTNMTLHEFCKASLAHKTRVYYFDENEPYVGCMVPCRTANYQAGEKPVYSTAKVFAIDGIRCNGGNKVCIRGECKAYPSKT
ncbi:venom metalloproteinase antarease TserMP_A-like [Ornithodoros turicata]|uniref:venom metalloproteinase antarease TserMP_A-like n=1 Tax=Ornithodoros turicata TaxID=34597 RepID=UPI0031398D26